MKLSTVKLSTLRIGRPSLHVPRGRRGSILILVVGLVVILALLGTAFITTARVDRYNSTVTVTATLVGAEASSVQEDISGVIIGDLFADPATKLKYRPGETNGAYNHWDANRQVSGGPTDYDTWLADRLPVLPTLVVGGTPVIAWQTVSQVSSATFVDVASLKVGTPPQLLQVPYEKGASRPSNFLVPTSITLVYPRSENEVPARTPKVVPAFQMYSVTGAGTASLVTADANGNALGDPSYHAFIAADADGDGVADSLLYDLHVSTPSSAGPVSYFAAVRIIDNNSAINANMAFSRVGDLSLPSSPAAQHVATPGMAEVPTAFQDALGKAIGPITSPETQSGNGAGNLGTFPGHEGLLELLDPNGTASTLATGYYEMDLLNQLRFGNSGNVSTSVYEGTTAAARTDVAFTTADEALFMQLGRRLANPAPTGLGRAQRYGVADDNNGDLSLQFGLINPLDEASVAGGSANGTTVLSGTVVDPFFAGTSSANIERRLVRSAYMNALNYTSDYADRFSLYPADKANYWYDYNFNAAANKTFDLTSDPERSTYTYLDAAAAGYTRNLRSILTTSNPTSNAIPIHDTGIPPGNTTLTGPQVPVPPVASATGSSYMAPYPASPTIPVKASINTAPFSVLWTAFWNVMCDDAIPTKIPQTPPCATTTFQVAPGIQTQYMQLLIRSALAAVNAEQMRAAPAKTAGMDAIADQPVISRRIVISDPTTSTDTATVEVFGSVPQPYISRWDGATLTVVDPANHNVDYSKIQVVYTDGATFKQVGTLPAMVPSTGVTVPLTGLPSTTQGSLLLLRTRAISGVAAKGTLANDPYDETGGSPGYAQWVPLDSCPVTGQDRGYTSLYPWTVTMARAGGAPQPGVQMQNADFPGQNPVAPTSNRFPFGSFARVGDILKVPFTGSYAIIAIDGTMLPVATQISGTVDLSTAFANITGEQPGRFCPISCDPTVSGTNTSFDWTKKIFDYFTTIQNPNDDYTPNVTPLYTDDSNPTIKSTTGVQVVNAGATPVYPGYTTPPLPIANTNGATPNNNNENNVGVDGLININTAPWQVLATLPMVPFHQGYMVDSGTAPDAASGIAEDDNTRLAKAIVYYRDVSASSSGPPHGPFKSVFELNNVVDNRPGADPTKGFQNRYGAYPTTAAAFNTLDTLPGDGDFAPITAVAGTSDGVPGDFEKKFLTLTNISNLITTRSDTFTCYVLVQAWRNVGLGPTVPPELVAEKRLVFVANRCTVGPGYPQLSIRQIAN